MVGEEEGREGGGLSTEGGGIIGWVGIEILMGMSSGKGVKASKGRGQEKEEGVEMETQDD